MQIIRTTNAYWFCTSNRMPIHIPPCTSENASNGGCTSNALGTWTPKCEQSSSVACPIEMKEQSIYL